MTLTPEALAELGKPQSFHVEAVTGEDEWTGNYGPMKTYRLRLTIGEEVDLNQKPETPAPTPGQEIYGHLEDGKYRPRMKKDKRPDGARTRPGNFIKPNGNKSDAGPAIHRQVALKILAPLVIKEGLSDSVRAKVAQIEEFISEAGKGDPVAAVKEAFDAKPAEGSTPEDDPLPF